MEDTHFLPSWNKINYVMVGGGTSLIGITNLSPVKKLDAGTGTVLVQS
jgi:hypothetical protein